MLVKLKPHAKESLQSYLIRLCVKNGWTKKALNTHFRAEVAPIFSTKSDDRKKIINYLIKETLHKELIDIVDIWSIAAKYKGYFDLTKIKFCPKCYAERAYLPPMWSIRHKAVCTVHNELLLDHCSHCHQKLDEESFRLNHCCYCLAPLKKMMTRQVTPDKYSEEIGLIFNGFLGSTNQFIELFKKKVMPIVAEIAGLYPLIILYENDALLSRNARRELTVKNLYHQSIQAQHLANDQEYLIGGLTEYIDDACQMGESNLGTILIAFKPILKNESCQFFNSALYKLIFFEPESIPDCRIGIKWLESFLDLRLYTLSSFARKYCSHFLLDTQVPSLSVFNVQKLMSEYDSFFTSSKTSI